MRAISRCARGLWAASLLLGCQADDGVRPNLESPGGDAGVTNDAGANTWADAGESDDSGSWGPGSGSDANVSYGPCDFAGIWIARMNTQSKALGGLNQYANNWYYLELEQDGDDVVVKDHVDCGIEVQGSVLVQLAPETTRALMQHNRQVGRKARVEQDGDGTCGLSFEHFWSVRGLSEDLYVPKPRNTSESLEAVQAKQMLPTSPSQTEDWDGDGKPGVRWNVQGIVSGPRHSVQRDWQRWFTAQGYEILDRHGWPDDLLIRAEFSNEEVVYEASFGLDQVSTPDSTAEHTLKLRFLGRSADDPRAKALIKADDFDTCIAIQDALPAIKGLK